MHAIRTKINGHVSTESPDLYFVAINHFVYLNVQGIPKIIINLRFIVGPVIVLLIKWTLINRRSNIIYNPEVLKKSEK